MPISELKDLTSIIGTLVAVLGMAFAIYKTLQEVQRFREQRQHELEQRERELQLKRIEFTLGQHRRLFDDPALVSVLKLLDGDHRELRAVEMWEPKRKFLTFFEEIVLLINSGFISKDVALYMFGYYAREAHRGENFKLGIDYKPEFWALFVNFAEEAEKYLDSPVDVQMVRELTL